MYDGILKTTTTNDFTHAICNISYGFNKPALLVIRRPTTTVEQTAQPVNFPLLHIPLTSSFHILRMNFKINNPAIPYSAYYFARVASQDVESNFVRKYTIEEVRSTYSLKRQMQYNYNYKLRLCVCSHAVRVTVNNPKILLF